MGGHLREPLRELAECSLPAALEAMGERWSFMILRAAFNGLHHFEEFQSELGIARNILANRLARLVEHGILKRERAARGSPQDPISPDRQGHGAAADDGRAAAMGRAWETGMAATPVLVDARDMRPNPAGPGPVARRPSADAKGDLLWALPEDVVGDNDPLQQAAE